MERLVQVVEQLAEASRCIRQGTLAHARIALLLLDNAVEVLMHRAITNEQSYDDFYVQLYKSARSSLPSDVVQRFINESGHILIPEKQRKMLGRLFVPKVDFLVERKHLNPTVGEVVKALHRYRNDAYHRDKIRKGTIQPAATIYLEVACDVLLSLPTGGISYSSSDDWSEFLKTYSLKGPFIEMPQDIEKITAKLRSEVGIDTKTLTTLLSEHLLSRLDSIQENLQFVLGPIAHKCTPEEALVRFQFSKEKGAISLKKAQAEFENYVPQYRGEVLSEWRNEANGLAANNKRDKLQSLKYFCELEQKMEPLEAIIEEAAVELDRAIQLEIDISLGK